MSNVLLFENYTKQENNKKFFLVIYLQQLYYSSTQIIKLHTFGLICALLLDKNDEIHRVNTLRKKRDTKKKFKIQPQSTKSHRIYVENISHAYETKTTAKSK